MRQTFNCPEIVVRAVLLLPEILFSKRRLCKQRNDLLWKSPGGSRIVHAYRSKQLFAVDINFALTERLRTSNVRKVSSKSSIFWNAFMERKIDQRSVIISPRHFRLSYRYVYFWGKPRSFKRDFFAKTYGTLALSPPILYLKSTQWCKLFALFFSHIITILAQQQYAPITPLNKTLLRHSSDIITHPTPSLYTHLVTVQENFFLNK